MKQKHIPFILACLLIFASVLSAKQLSIDTASLSELGTFIDDLAQADRFSGVVLIAKNNEIVFQKACGKADQENDVANCIETSFDIASMGKMFTGVAIAQLVENKKLSYKDRLVSILPTLSEDIFGTITIEQLLTHSSGLGDIFGPAFFAIKDTAKTLQSYVNLSINEPLLFEPGTDVKYSNYAYILLGAVIEKVSGESYYDYIDTHIFKAVDMDFSDFDEGDQVNPNAAIGYALLKAPPNAKMPPPPGRVNNKRMIGIKGTSAGGVFSSATDLLTFSLALQKGKLISKKSFKNASRGKVSVPKPPTPPGMKPLPDLKFAYGFGEFYVNGQRIIGHNGGAPGVDAQMDIYPKLGYTVIVLSNYDRTVMPVIDRIQEMITRLK